MRRHSAELKLGHKPMEVCRTATRSAASRYDCTNDGWTWMRPSDLERRDEAHRVVKDDLSMDDVFDTSGRPPKGWMNAIFDEGPYGDDVGRCVPGPPPTDEFTAKGVTYFLRTVGSWSDPDNPIAIYGLTREHTDQHRDD